jgi:hypothetical protein
VNPALVYVPYYNPWVVYGAPIAAWGGYYWGPPSGVAFRAGIAIGFGVGIGIGLFAHYGWGYHAWSPNWHGGVVVYNHATYISRSTTVINRGHFGGFNRGVYEHAGAGVPGGYHPAVTAQTAVFAHSGGPGTYRPRARIRRPPRPTIRRRRQPTIRPPARRVRRRRQPIIRRPAQRVHLPRQRIVRRPTRLARRRRQPPIRRLSLPPRPRRVGGQSRRPTAHLKRSIAKNSRWRFAAPALESKVR